MRPEEGLHRAVAHYLQMVLAPEVVWSTFPSGGGGKVRGARLKAMGLRAGMPDIMLWWRGDHGRCLGIELKAPRGGLSAAQRETFAALDGAGCPVEVVRSIAEVRVALDSFGVPLKARAV